MRGLRRGDRGVEHAAQQKFRVHCAILPRHWTMAWPPKLLKSGVNAAMVEIMNAASKNLLWLQAGSCGGCTMAVLEHGAAGWFAELKTFGIKLLWHPGVSEETGEEVLEIFARVENGDESLDILCVEGSILRGPHGTGKFNRLSGTDRTLLDLDAQPGCAGGCLRRGRHLRRFRRHSRRRSRPDRRLRIAI